MASLEYYYSPTSHWSRIVSLCLAEKGLRPERHFIDIATNANYAPEYLRINPRGVVPTLVHEGRIVVDSVQICTYLANFGGPEIQGGDLGARWTKRLSGLPMKHMSYQTWIGRGRYPLSRLQEKVSMAWACAAKYPDLKGQYERKGKYFARFLEELHDPVFMATVHDTLRRALAELAAHLANRDFIVGESWSKADACASAVLVRLEELGALPRLTADRGALDAYVGRLQARPSFTAVFREDPVLVQ